jgi:hypothetical protein
MECVIPAEPNGRGIVSNFPGDAKPLSKPDVIALGLGIVVTVVTIVWGLDCVSNEVTNPDSRQVDPGSRTVSPKDPKAGNLLAIPTIPLIYGSALKGPRVL